MPPQLIELIEPLLNDPTIMEIMVDSYDKMYAEKRGELVDLPSPFTSEDQLLTLLSELAATFGRRLDESNPMADFRFPDGTRMFTVIPPISLKGPVFNIRKMPQQQLTGEDLLRFGTLDEDMMTFLRACVLATLNIVVSGGTGSGKTTVLNIIIDMIPDSERLVIVQHNAELRLKHQRVVVLETRPANLEGKGEVTARDLIQAAMKMRPDRIIVTELHAGEVQDAVTAMNTGHDGSLASLHAVSVRDALARMELMAASADPTVPLLRIREMMASALDVILQQERLSDGTRRITRISEVVGLQGDQIATQDIFEFRQTGIKDGKVQGYFTATGHIPHFLSRFRDRGIKMDVQKMFSPR